LVILGFNCSRVGDVESPFAHDSAAALVRDGHIVAASEEERFNRHKHSGVLPEHAIRFCLREGRLALDDVDAFCFYWNTSIDRRNMQAASVGTFDILNRHSLRLTIPDDVFRHFREALSFDVPSDRRVFIDHHVCHAASAYYCSGFDRSAFLIVDAYGEMSSVSSGVADASGVSVLSEVLLPTSLGVLYNSVTQLLGFHGRDDEFKVMGLAAYGRPDRFRDLFRALWTPTDAGVLYPENDMSRSAALKLAEYRRVPGQPPTHDHQDLAAALQESTEEQLVHMATRLRERTGETNLCLAGGVMQNSVANGRLASRRIFQRIFIQPASHDAGTALGAALFESARRASRSSAHSCPFTPFLGPQFSRTEMVAACAAYDAEIRTSAMSDPAERIARELAAGKVVGWLQGRMEFGPRALGARSILADPRTAAIRDKVNAIVKHREPFRPFAPSILEEQVPRFFDVIPGIDLSLMVYTLPVKPERRADIPAVVHCDGSARVHSVSRRTDPAFWQLLSAFEALTGVPVLLNTSFNVNGEPIVCTPQDAIECFLSTAIDLLVLGDLLVERVPLSRDQSSLARPLIQNGTDVRVFVGSSRPSMISRRHVTASVDPLALEVLRECDGAQTVREIAELFRAAADEDEAAETNVYRAIEFLLRLRVIRLLPPVTVDVATSPDGAP
jgi:carbamoyltransferase